MQPEVECDSLATLARQWAKQRMIQLGSLLTAAQVGHQVHMAAPGTEKEAHNQVLAELAELDDFRAHLPRSHSEIKAHTNTHMISYFHRRMLAKQISIFHFLYFHFLAPFSYFLFDEIKTVN